MPKHTCNIFGLYLFQDKRPIPKVPKDLLLAELLKKHEKLIWKYHDHDSLLENQADEHLTEEDRKAAWEEFENEKKGITNLAVNSAGSMMNERLALSNINPAMIQVSFASHMGGAHGRMYTILSRMF